MKSGIKKFLALLLILSLLLVVGLTVYCAVIGSDFFWGMMVLMFFYPVFLWAMSYLYKWSRNHDQKS